MDRLSPRWQAAIALTAVGIVVGASVTVVDDPIVGSDLTGTPLALLGGLVTVLAARATDSHSPLTAD
jgi:hypothetical protein